MSSTCGCQVFFTGILGVTCGFLTGSKHQMNHFCADRGGPRWADVWRSTVAHAAPLLLKLYRVSIVLVAGISNESAQQEVWMSSTLHQVLHSQDLQRPSLLVFGTLAVPSEQTTHRIDRSGCGPRPFRMPSFGGGQPSPHVLRRESGPARQSDRACGS